LVIENNQLDGAYLALLNRLSHRQAQQWKQKKDDVLPAEGEEDQSINREEEDTKKSEEGGDLPKVPVIDLHYDALVPNGHMDSTHVHKIYGYKIKSREQVKLLIAQWQDWKKEVRRVWAAFEIKQKIKDEALQMPKITSLQLLQ
jgi:hypothetical protein